MNLPSSKAAETWTLHKMNICAMSYTHRRNLWKAESVKSMGSRIRQSKFSSLLHRLVSNTILSKFLNLQRRLNENLYVKSKGHEVSTMSLLGLEKHDSLECETRVHLHSQVIQVWKVRIKGEGQSLQARYNVKEGSRWDKESYL